jgi:hypothetical protein
VSLEVIELSHLSLDKISGDLCRFTCDTRLGCGGQMPFGQLLAEPERGLILAWIRGGASTD